MQCEFLGDGDNDSELSGGVRKFYKKQDRLIDSIKEFHRNQLGLGDDENAVRLARQKRHIEWLVRATVVVNCVGSDYLVKRSSEEELLDLF